MLSFRFLIVCTFVWLSFGLQAKTPDGEPPAEESVCDNLIGVAFGLCNAYCEAMDCDSDEPRASLKSCARIFEKFDKIVGEAPPCVAVEVEFEVVKRCSPVAAPGETITYVIDYLSTSEHPFNSVVIADYLPAGLELIGYDHQWNAVYLDNNPASFPPTTNFSTPQFVVEVGSLNYLEGGTLVVFGRVDEGFASGSELTNEVLGVAFDEGGEYTESQDQCSTLITDS